MTSLTISTSFLSSYITLTGTKNIWHPDSGHKSCRITHSSHPQSCSFSVCLRLALVHSSYCAVTSNNKLAYQQLFAYPHLIMSSAHNQRLPKYLRPVWSNYRPVGCMWPATAFSVACGSIQEKSLILKFVEKRVMLYLSH